MAQTKLALDIFEERFDPGVFQGAFGFDNAPSHQKRAPDALSARYMPLKPKAWLGKSGTTKMRAGTFADGRPQPFYYDDTHPTRPGEFKGMKTIITERGL